MIICLDENLLETSVEKSLSLNFLERNDFLGGLKAHLYECHGKNLCPPQDFSPHLSMNIFRPHMSKTAAHSSTHPPKKKRIPTCRDLAENICELPGNSSRLHATVNVHQLFYTPKTQRFPVAEKNGTPCFPGNDVD